MDIIDVMIAILTSMSISKLYFFPGDISIFLVAITFLPAKRQYYIITL